MKKPETKTKPSKAPQALRGVSAKKEAPKAQASKAAPPVVPPKANPPAKPRRRKISTTPNKNLTPIPGPQGNKLVQSGKSGLAISRNVKPAGADISKLVSQPEVEERSGRGKRGKAKTAGKTEKSKAPLKLVQLIPKQKPNITHSLPVKKEKMLMRFGKPTKRVLFTVDFLLKASPTIVYHFITTPSCLVRWFCDAVDITNEYYTFSWNGSTEVAELIDDIEDERLKFQWLDGEDEEEFFEFRISTADITDETILEIVDFAWADEVEEQKELWRTQVENLRKETGDA